MIKYETIKKAKLGNEHAISEILDFYLMKIKRISKDDEFIQMALIAVYRGIIKFGNRR